MVVPCGRGTEGRSFAAAASRQIDRGGALQVRGMAWAGRSFAAAAPAPQPVEEMAAPAAALMIIGDEVLSGSISDSNTPFLAKVKGVRFCAHLCLRCPLLVALALLYCRHHNHPLVCGPRPLHSCCTAAA